MANVFAANKEEASEREMSAHKKKCGAAQVSTRRQLRTPRQSINVPTDTFGTFNRIHEIVNYMLVRNICFSITSDRSNCIMFRTAHYQVKPTQLYAMIFVL